MTGNAIKFTSQGEVVIRVRLVSESAGGIRLRFAVRDTGIGIPADKVGGLFTMFTQADPSITRTYGGTGLGLAISKQLAEMMGGEIGVQSEEGKGSEFWFTVRLAQSQPDKTLRPAGNSKKKPPGAAVANPPPDFALQQGHARILVAEDNVINQQVSVGILKKLGLRADVAANGLEAVKALESIPYDLVLMDVQMPGMDGFQATRKIRDPQSDVLNHQVIIIAMTAHALQGDREKCLAAGMNDYVTKPVEVSALGVALQKWLQIKGNGDQVPAAGKKAAAVPPGGPLPVFDRADLMHRVMNDTALARVVTGAFLKDMPGQILQLKNHVAAGEAHPAEQQAHKIKGACGTVGGAALCALASELEQAARAGDLTGLSARLAELDAQFLALQKALNPD